LPARRERPSDALLGGVEVEIVGIPDYLILEGSAYLIRELDKIYLWRAQVYGEKPSEFMAS
jgi:hypothetical protein